MSTPELTGGDTTEIRDSVPSIDPEEFAHERLALMIAWARDEPNRVGEILFLPAFANAPTLLVGRGGPRPDDPHVRAGFVRQRPGRNEPTAPLTGNAISRHQLVLRYSENGSLIENVGKCPLSIGGREVARAVVKAGECLALAGHLLFYCTRRPLMLPALRTYPVHTLHPFGGPDEHGIVGESPRAWLLRDELAFAARRDLHVLLLGETGSGKELAARAIHALSERGRRPMLSRSAATIPSGLMDAELFGNIKDYPNAGMRERLGLIGRANGTTLFLDEIGELPEELQSHLLRVLDRTGEYHRLGEEQARRSDFRLLAATNRSVFSLKHDIAARLTLRIEMPGLNERREDVPLLARHILRQSAREDSDIRTQYFEAAADPPGEPRVSPRVVEALLSHQYTQHVRELTTTLWRCMAASQSGWIGISPEIEQNLRQSALPRETPLDEVAPEQIRDALLRHNGVIEAVWRELGLRNRHVLRRLMKKHDIAPGR